jgi:hypothetical protein
MIDEFFFITTIIFVFALSCIAFLFVLKAGIEQTRLPGGRIFGLNCDRCEGKRDKKGRYLWRCYIKPHIVDILIQCQIIEDRSKGE